MTFKTGSKGRLNRLSYLVGGLILPGVLLILGSPILVLLEYTEVNIMALGGILLVVALWLMFTSAVKRLHDMNLSGWFVSAPFPVSIILLAVYVVSQNLVLLIVLAVWTNLSNLVGIIVLFCVQGTEGTNQFGEDPRTKSVWKVLSGE